MNLYDQLKDHPRFPKEKKYSPSLGYSPNKSLQEFIDFLKSVCVDKEKVSDQIEHFFDAYDIPLATKKYSADDLVSAFCQDNIIGDER